MGFCHFLTFLNKSFILEEMNLIRVPNPTFDAGCTLLLSSNHDIPLQLPKGFNPQKYDAVLLEGHETDQEPQTPKKLKKYKIEISTDEKPLIESFSKTSVLFFNVDIYKQRIHQTLDMFFFFSDFFREITLAQKASFLVREKINKENPEILINWGEGHTKKILEYLQITEAERLKLIEKRKSEFQKLFNAEWSSAILKMKPRKKNNNFDVVEVFEEPKIKAILS